MTTSTRQGENVSETITVCSLGELPAGAMRIIEGADGRKLGVFRCDDGELYAI